MTQQDIATRSPLDEYIAELGDAPQYAVPFTACPDYPMVQYSKGVNVVSGISPKRYTGWHIAPLQDPALDNLLAGMGVQVDRVKHHNGTEGSYWRLDNLDGYLLCKSVPAKYGPDVWQKSGIAYVWNNYEKDAKGNKTFCYGSQLQALFFLRDLLDRGYTQPLVVSLSRTVTDCFVLRVLRKQEAFLEAVKRAFAKSGKAYHPSSYAFWMTLAKDEEEFFPKGGGSYFPPTMVIAPPLTASYLREHQATPAHIEIIESFATTMLDTWAQSASLRLMEPPKDTPSDAQPTEPAEESPAPTMAQGAKQAEKAGPVNDPTIVISSLVPERNMLALYNAAWGAKQRGIKNGLFAENQEWLQMLSGLGITEFEQGHIGLLNQAIDALLAYRKAEQAEQAATA